MKSDNKRNPTAARMIAVRDKVWGGSHESQSTITADMILVPSRPIPAKIGAHSKIVYSNPMSRICTTAHRAFPKLKFIGMCHEIASLARFLPEILGVPYESLAVQAGGLNHFSVVLSARDKASGADVYPAIRAGAAKFFSAVPSMNAIHKYFKETGQWPNTREDLASLETEAWPERKVFKVILEEFGLLPITSDSHFGEYIAWAYDAADHRGIHDFYRFYRNYLGALQPRIELKLSERIVSVVEGLLTNSGYVEEAVNIPNRGVIAELPEWLVVEVPGVVNATGVHGVPVGPLPRAFAGLLMNQIGV